MAFLPSLPRNYDGEFSLSSVAYWLRSTWTLSCPGTGFQDVLATLVFSFCDFSFQVRRPFSCEAETPLLLQGANDHRRFPLLGPLPPAVAVKAAPYGVFPVSFSSLGCYASSVPNCSSGRYLALRRLQRLFRARVFSFDAFSCPGVLAFGCLQERCRAMTPPLNRPLNTNLCFFLPAVFFPPKVSHPYGLVSHPLLG